MPSSTLQCGLVQALVLWPFLLLLLPRITQGKSVFSVIRDVTELSNFTRALQLAGMDAVLDDEAQQFTVFAPSNDAIDRDPVFSTYMSEDGWFHHLRTNLQFMIVPNQALSDEMIFDGFTSDLVTLNGTLAISQPFATVNLVQTQIPNLSGATNGVVHIMSGVIKNYWREYTLRDDVDQLDELEDGLSPILDRLGFDDPLNEFVESGTSWIAARNRGYGDDSIALGFNDIVQELTNPNNVEFQWEAYLYNLVDFNLYEQDVQRGLQLLVMPRAGVAHMWITKDNDAGILRFNDAILDRQTLADNGVTQIVTKPLVPPGMAMLLQYTADFTTINVRDMATYFSESGWNLRDMTQSIGVNGGGLNMFVPLQDGFGAFNIEVAVRLSTLEWQRHLWDFLKHTMAEPARTTERWYEVVQEAGGTLAVEMLSGFNTTFVIDDDGDLTIDGARLLKPDDLKGVDGYIHFVEQVPLPPSILLTVYDQIQQNPQTSTATRLFDAAQFGEFIDSLLPMTLFAPVNSAWDVIIPFLEIPDVLKNFMFQLLWFDDYLADMDGENITSANGKKWNIQVIDDPNGHALSYAPERNPVKIYISNAEGPKGLTNCSVVPGPKQTNILARTGIIHYIDCLFLDFNYTRVDPLAPTFAPVTVNPPPAFTTSPETFTSVPTMDTTMASSVSSSLGASTDQSFEATGTMDQSVLEEVAVLAQEAEAKRPKSPVSPGTLRKRADGARY
ncbi:Transforming growth factor, beta-induced, 68kDa [Seminavis robusta]|uniref:Transforming growth factor, beta-induced, 68kDa n=1 Tax=Seminavis robusta TaxID=568900 RepID=A0A9N8HH45_9STRA|nr:Transforming growth factor, beta-induced, 68kDa [Seminavis robusta]|eukprot:Sro430_g141250.1 Transforming growth factor, beta-induced, 68kDa (728) ;mRNA; f:5187-7672